MACEKRRKIGGTPKAPEVDRFDAFDETLFRNALLEEIRATDQKRHHQSEHLTSQEMKSQTPASGAETASSMLPPLGNGADASGPITTTREIAPDLQVADCKRPSHPYVAHEMVPCLPMSNTTRASPRPTVNPMLDYGIHGNVLQGSSQGPLYTGPRTFTFHPPPQAPAYPHRLQAFGYRATNDFPTITAHPLHPHKPVNQPPSLCPTAGQYRNTSFKLRHLVAGHNSDQAGAIGFPMHPSVTTHRYNDPRAIGPGDHAATANPHHILQLEFGKRQERDQRRRGNRGVHEAIDTYNWGWGRDMSSRPAEKADMQVQGRILSFSAQSPVDTHHYNDAEPRGPAHDAAVTKLQYLTKIKCVQRRQQDPKRRGIGSVHRAVEAANREREREREPSSQIDVNSSVQDQNRATRCTFGASHCTSPNFNAQSRSQQLQDKATICIFSAFHYTSSKCDALFRTQQPSSSDH